MSSMNGRILFITQWKYDDALVQTYTLPYIRIITNITSSYPYLITMKEGSKSTTIEKKNGVIVIQMPSGKRLLYMGWLLNFLKLYIISGRKNIRLIHAWCTTAGTIGALLKLLDKRKTLVIDSFEPHAEAMVENESWRSGGIKFKSLFYMEKLEAAIADHLIFAAPGMENYILKKYKTQVTNFYVKPACTDLDMFSDKYMKDEALMAKYCLQDKIVCVYAGKFGGIYLEDETFAFIQSCDKYWGDDRFRFLLLSNVSEEYIREKISKFSIRQSVVIKLFIPHSEVPSYMGLADFAICPVKPVESKKYCSPIKNGEYWAMGLPIVITPNISVDSDLIRNNHAGAILEGFTDADYKNAIKQVDSILQGKSRREVYTLIRPLAEKYRNFGIAENVYKKIYGQIS